MIIQTSLKKTVLYTICHFTMSCSKIYVVFITSPKMRRVQLQVTVFGINFNYKPPNPFLKSNNSKENRKGNTLRERFIKKNRRYTLLSDHKKGARISERCTHNYLNDYNAKQNCQNNLSRSLLNTLKLYALLHVWKILTKAEKRTQSFSFKIKTE